jgi:hypothetical protein
VPEQFDGFYGVRDVALRVGATSCCAYVDGCLVVDFAPPAPQPVSLATSGHAASMCLALLVDRDLVEADVLRRPHDPEALVGGATGQSLADFFRSMVEVPLGLMYLDRAQALARMYAAAVGPVDGVRLLRAPAALDLPPLSLLGIERTVGHSFADELAFAIPGARVGFAVVTPEGGTADVARAFLECLYSADLDEPFAARERAGSRLPA